MCLGSRAMGSVGFRLFGVVWCSGFQGASACAPRCRHLGFRVSGSYGRMFRQHNKAKPCRRIHWLKPGNTCKV